MYLIFIKEMFVYIVGYLVNKDCELCFKVFDFEVLFGCSCKQRGDILVKSWGLVGGGGGVYLLFIVYIYYRLRLFYLIILYIFKVIKVESKKDEFL